MPRHRTTRTALLMAGMAACTSGNGAGGEVAGGGFATPAAGRVRAGVLQAMADLPSPDGDFIGAQPGDLVLANDHLVAVVRAASEGLTLPGFHGGGLVDLYRPGAADTLREHQILIGFREVRPTHMEVAATGEGGETAVVRVDGEDTDIYIIPKDFPIQSGVSLGARISTEYRLGPDDDFLTLRTTVRRPGAPAESLSAGDALYISHPGEPFLPGVGRAALEIGVASAPHLVQGGLGMVADPPNPSGLALSIDNITALLPGDILTGEGRSAAYVRRLYAGDPDAAPAHLAGRMLEFEGRPTGALRVEGTPDDGVVEVRAPNGDLLALGDGRGPFPVPAGPVRVRALVDGRMGPEADATVIAGEESLATLSAPASATITIAARSGDGADLPARAQVFPLGGDRVVALLPPGGRSVRVPPGELRVVVSRGFEYEIHDETLTVDVGAEAFVDAVVRRVVDTPRAISTDTHIHSLWSPDSKVPEGTRILSIAAEGVEAPVSTDHDHITPYRVPEALRPWVRDIVGTEVSTSDYGHFNAYPLVPEVGAPRNGSPPWLGLMPRDVFASIRAAGEGVVVQVNHPDSGDGTDFFDAFGVTPDDLPAFDLGFDTVEVYNRGEGARIDQVLGHMHRVLNTGKRAGFVGVSDSHTIERWVGHPRSHVLMDADTPQEVTPEAFADAVRGGRTVVTGGAYVEASVGGVGPGGEVATGGSTVTVDIRVQAPSWVPVDRVVVVTPDGEVAVETDLEEGVVRFEGAITVASPSGPGPGWLYVRADAAGDMAPVLDGPVFSATSPIYLR